MISLAAPLYYDAQTYSLTKKSLLMPKTLLGISLQGFLLGLVSILLTISVIGSYTYALETRDELVSFQKGSISVTYSNNTKVTIGLRKVGSIWFLQADEGRELLFSNVNQAIEYCRQGNPDKKLQVLECQLTAIIF
jgi:hypothetical protein